MAPPAFSGSENRAGYRNSYPFCFNFARISSKIYTPKCISGTRIVWVARKPIRDEALARLRAIGAKISPNFKLNREEANER